MNVHKPLKTLVLSTALSLMAVFSASSELVLAGGPAKSIGPNSAFTASSKAGILLPALRPAPMSPAQMLLPALRPTQTSPTQMLLPALQPVPPNYFMTPEDEFLFWLDF